ncbi:MAG: HAD-IIIC family phosphatase [Leptospirales bacterium]
METPALKAPANEMIAVAMHRIDAQLALFTPRTRRLAIQALKLDFKDLRKVTINVWRNHTFENIASLSAPFCEYGGWQADFRVSDYDDAFLFANHQVADIELLWLDSSRYLINVSIEAWFDWLDGRIRELRASTTSPIIVASWLNDPDQQFQMQGLADAIPGVYFADLDAVCREAGVPLIDLRSSKMSGTPVSSAAQLLLARKLSCHWLPAVLFPPIKAVALDLDHTLHNGVLGEDGIDGVELTPAHLAFQNFLKSLQQHGIFIGLVSRNEHRDVETLFAQREDYPLRWDDFSAFEISWGDKASAIMRVAQTLLISPDSVLFVDDNPGELASVASQLPQVHTVYAHSDASITHCAVEYYPGLWRWKINTDDTKRILDLKTNAERELLRSEAVDPASYFRSLQVTLLYRVDANEQLSRLADLCQKTNQFNLTMRRFNQAEVAERLQRNDSCVISVQMKDRLSDSGVIAVIVTRRHGDRLEVEELCVSCRAMGRQLEDTLILTAIRDMPLFLGCREVTFNVQHGPRNQPALNWLSRLLAIDNNPEPGLHHVPAETFLRFMPADGVTLIKEGMGV